MVRSPKSFLILDIREAILEEHSKAQTQKIARYIGPDKERFAHLIDLFLHDEYRVTQRAGWVLTHCCDRYPWLITPHLEPILLMLEKPDLHDAVKRNALRAISKLELPDDVLGLAATVCFDYLANVKEKVAVKVWAMETIYQICKKEPDLAGELRLLIEDQWEHESAAFHSRGRKILKGLDLLQK